MMVSLLYCPGKESKGNCTDNEVSFKVFVSSIPNAILRGVLFQYIDNELILIKCLELFREQGQLNIITAYHN